MSINEKNGKEAVTHYHVLKRFRRFTYVECQLETGRTHQIRVHMASIGHPLLGDQVYGPARYRFPAFRVRPSMRGAGDYSSCYGRVHGVSRTASGVF